MSLVSTAIPIGLVIILSTAISLPSLLPFLPAILVIYSFHPLFLPLLFQSLSFSSLFSSFPLSETTPLPIYIIITILSILIIIHSILITILSILITILFILITTLFILITILIRPSTSLFLLESLYVLSPSSLFSTTDDYEH